MVGLVVLSESNRKSLYVKEKVTAHSFAYSLDVLVCNRLILDVFDVIATGLFRTTVFNCIGFHEFFENSS